MQLTPTNALIDLVGVLVKANAAGEVDDAMYNVGISDAYSSALSQAVKAMGNDGAAAVMHFYGVDVTNLIDDTTTTEPAAPPLSGPEAARTFFQELLDSVETLSAIAEVHGVRTLADLMYLQSAILKNTCIEHISGESKVLEIARDLPSGFLWTTFISVLDTDQK